MGRTGMNFGQSKLSNLANSLSGFYREHEKQEGLSSRMKESEVARRIPNFKEKKGGRKESAEYSHMNNMQQEQSDMSLYQESGTYNQNMWNAFNNVGREV